MWAFVVSDKGHTPVVTFNCSVSAVCLLVAHYLAFQYFAEEWHTFQEVHTHTLHFGIEGNAVNLPRSDSCIPLV